MKIEVAAQGFKEVECWLRETCQIRGPIIGHKIRDVKVRTDGAIVPKDAEYGRNAKLYGITLWDQLAVENNVQYVLV